MGGSTDLTPLETSHHEFSPWDFWEQPDGAAHAAQLALQERLSAARGYTFGERCFVSALAAVQNETLVLGERSYVAAGACASGTLRTGADCSISPYYVVRGAARLGDGVRVGTHTSVLGFNQTFSEPDQPVFHQPRASQAIVIGSDVWIGLHVVGLDGVAISSGAVVGLGRPPTSAHSATPSTACRGRRTGGDPAPGDAAHAQPPPAREALLPREPRNPGPAGSRRPGPPPTRGHRAAPRGRRALQRPSPARLASCSTSPIPSDSPDSSDTARPRSTDPSPEPALVTVHPKVW